MYSEQSLTFNVATWRAVQFVALGFFLSCSLLGGALAWNLADDTLVGIRSADEVMSENEVLRYSVNVMESEVRKLEMETDLMRARAMELHSLFHRNAIVVDTLAHVAQTAREFTFRALNPDVGEFTDVNH